jgi:hypothetical protein
MAAHVIALVATLSSNDTIPTPEEASKQSNPCRDLYAYDLAPQVAPNWPENTLVRPLHTVNVPRSLAA